MMLMKSQNVILLPLLGMVMSDFVAGQSCSFTKSFGSGVVLSSSGVESFEASANAGTACSLSCGTGVNTGLALYIRYGGAANVILNDANGLAAAGCGISVSTTSSSAETSLGYLVTATSYADLSLSCSCTQAGTADPGCFSADTTVRVRGKDEPVRMDELQVGDLVQSASGAYQPVYSFGHQEHDQEMEYLQIYYTKDETDNEKEEEVEEQPRPPLEMSFQHLLFVEDTTHGATRVVRADTIKEGDVLVLLESGAAAAGKGRRATVTRVWTTSKVGAYMPLTPDGTIVVNDDGIQVSSYVSIADEDGTTSKVLTSLEYYGFSEQQLSHWWLSPFRMLCMGVSSTHFCSTNPIMMSTSNNKEYHGILKWLLVGREYARTANGYSFWVHHLLGLPTLLLFGFFVLVETAFGPTWAPTATVLLTSSVLGFWWHRRHGAVHHKA